VYGNTRVKRYLMISRSHPRPQIRWAWRLACVPKHMHTCVDTTEFVLVSGRTLETMKTIDFVVLIYASPENSIIRVQPCTHTLCTNRV
jgi:hypothetical protein